MVNNMLYLNYITIVPLAHMVDVAGTDTPGQGRDISRPGDPGGGWPVYVASWAEYAPRGCGLAS